MHRLLFIAAMLVASAAAQAQPATLTLSEAQKQEILAARVESDLAMPVDLPRLNERRPHGEVGIMVGTGGARGIYGVTSVPLGNNGWATFGFENSQNLWPPGY